MAEEQAIPDEILEQAHNVYIAARLLARGGPCKAGEMIWHPIAQAILAAELRGRQQATDEFAAMLKNPAGVLVNWKRGYLDASSIVTEATIEQIEADARIVEALACETIEPAKFETYVDEYGDVRSWTTPETRTRKLLSAAKVATAIRSQTTT